jgi:hypothetical protein
LEVKRQKEKEELWQSYGKEDCIKRMEMMVRKGKRNESK